MAPNLFRSHVITHYVVLSSHMFSRTASGSTTTASTLAAAASGEPALSMPTNSFNNDGSFFENFKRITEAAKKAQEEKEAKLNAPALPIMTTLSQAQQELGHSPIEDLVHK